MEKSIRLRKLSEDERLAFYTTARAEVLERIRLRDYALVAYIAAVGAFFAFIFKEGTLETSSASMLGFAALPFVCLIFSLVILQHHTALGRIAEYLVVELYPDTTPPCWDRSTTRAGNFTSPFPRAICQALLMVIPLIYSGMYITNGWIKSANNVNDRTVLMVLAAADIMVFLYIIYLHWMAFIVRQKSEINIRNLCKI